MLKMLKDKETGKVEEGVFLEREREKEMEWGLSDCFVYSVDLSRAK